MPASAGMTDFDGNPMKHFFDVDQLSANVLNALFAKIAYFKKIQSASTLANQRVLLFFSESSTRTLLSFEQAAFRLGAKVVRWDALSSAMQKGEGLADSIANAHTIVQPHFLVYRHASKEIMPVVQSLPICTVNAGVGIWAHPTQALIDAFVLCEHFGMNKVQDLSQIHLVIVGDIKHSRVVRSNLKLLSLLGAKITLVSPLELRGEWNAYKNVHHTTNFNEVLMQADAVMMLRMQRERDDDIKNLKKDEYIKNYSLSLERLYKAPKHCVVLHPGPIEPSMELDPQILESPRSLILKQAQTGVWVRMAILATVSLF